MKVRLLQISSVVLCSALFFACNKIPDHASYIPKDAVAVAGVNIKGLSKKIAWNLITGSKLFKEMQARIPEKSTKDAMSRIEKAGIDPLNTFYVYVKTDTRIKGGNRITGIVPLSDAGEWESYVKEVFPQAAIKEKTDRKEASLGSDMYVGWNKHVLIFINVSSVGGDGDEDGGMGKLSISSHMSDDDISAEMEDAFHVSADNAILGNPKFMALQSQGHDLSFWLNYEQLMTQYSTNMAGKMGGISLSNTLWKGASFTAGLDFLQGKISADMHYFLPDSMLAIGKDFGSANADQEMIGMLPMSNMDMVLTMHISPKGIKSSLEKMGMLSLADQGLATVGLGVDSILNAFTGDMAIVMNDFGLHNEKVVEPFMGQMVAHDVQKATISMSYVIKLNQKRNFQTILDLAARNGLSKMGDGFVVPLDDKDSVYVKADDHYAVISNKMSYADGFLSGAYKSQSKPSFYGELTSHPWGLYVDMQQFFKQIDPSISHSAHDSAVIMESRNLLGNISFSGGAFNNGAFDYHLDVNFNNKDENSIIEIMDYAMKISAADNSKSE